MPWAVFAEAVRHARHPIALRGLTKAGHPVARRIDTQKKIVCAF